jgi:hypothetical protein
VDPGNSTEPRLRSKPKPESMVVEAEVEAGEEAEGASEAPFSWACVSFLSSRVT